MLIGSAEGNSPPKTHPIVAADSLLLPSSVFSSVSSALRGVELQHIPQERLAQHQAYFTAKDGHIKAHLDGEPSSLNAQIACVLLAAFESYMSIPLVSSTNPSRPLHLTAIGCLSAIPKSILIPDTLDSENRTSVSYRSFFHSALRRTGQMSPCSPGCLLVGS
ncbi:unnamed protein product [Trypanosoma congolense IL3000]|uniref:WGS project CAEQ00000000 data, annotated contig 1324 n=1 Tax=Trypanosoma congolense (strain IL3000) TaxID=1068625 RepID=F9W5G8_TRYCI|nr:unnamed protein product [Trypanosoma congolense IL3000]